jgi:restriction system protein
VVENDFDALLVLSEKAEREKQAELAVEVELVQSAVRKHVLKHLPVLMRKHRQTVRQDEYGRTVTEDWYREVDYFLDRVLVEEFNAEATGDGQPIMQGKYSVDASEVSRPPLYWITRKHRDVARACVCESVRDAILQEGTSATKLVFNEQMSGSDFERFCAGELIRCGWTVRLIGGSGDQGGDLLAERGAHRVVVQCKKYGSPVGNAAVQEALAARHYHEGTATCVVSNAPYTRAAEQLAAVSGVGLLHYSELHKLAEMVERTKT